MKKGIIFTMLLFCYSLSLKAQQMYYPKDTQDVQECVSLMETPLGSEVMYRAKGSKKWVALKILNAPKMGGTYLVQFPDKSKQQVSRNPKTEALQIKNAATGKARIFEEKGIYFYEQDKTEYLKIKYFFDNNTMGFTSSLVQNGVVKSFTLGKEDAQNSIYEASLEDEEGLYIFKRINNDYELTLPNGTKKMYLMDAVSYE